jgi:hypothetical protein
MSEKTETTERRITVPKDIWTSLTYYANAEKIGIKPIVAATVTPETIAFEILRNELRRVGHYPPKTEVIADIQVGS